MAHTYYQGVLEDLDRLRENVYPPLETQQAKLETIARLRAYGREEHFLSYTPAVDVAVTEAMYWEKRKLFGTTATLAIAATAIIFPPSWAVTIPIAILTGARAVEAFIRGKGAKERIGFATQIIPRQAATPEALAAERLRPHTRRKMRRPHFSFVI